MVWKYTKTLKNNYNHYIEQSLYTGDYTIKYKTMANYWSIKKSEKKKEKLDNRWSNVLKQSAKDTDNSEEVFSMNPSGKLEKKMKKYDTKAARYEKKKAR